MRILHLDWSKLLTIYLVILGHVIGMLDPGLLIGGDLVRFIYTFHMPLFVLLSGYFVNSAYSKPFSSFVSGKAKQLLLPTISCTIIVCVYLYLFRETANYRNEVIGNSWFLKVLFIYFVLTYVLKKTRIDDWILFIVSCFFLFLIPHGYSLQLNLLYPYFWGGLFLRKYDILGKLTSSINYLVVVIIVFFCLYIYQCKNNIPIYIPITIETLFNQWNLILFRYLIGFLGCLAVILSVAFFYKQFNDNNWIINGAKYGQKTLGVYVLQTILVINVFPDVVHMNIRSEFLLNLIVAPIVSLIFLILCLLLIHVLSKNKMLDLFLFGGQYYNR